MSAESANTAATTTPQLATDTSFHVLHVVCNEHLKEDQRHQTSVPVSLGETKLSTLGRLTAPVNSLLWQPDCSKGDLDPGAGGVSKGQVCGGVQNKGNTDLALQLLGAFVLII